METIADGRVWPIQVGTLYARDKYDDHYLCANKGTVLRLICVFDPALTGRAAHDEPGVYPVLTEDD